jgi:hypothetical protein
MEETRVSPSTAAKTESGCVDPLVPPTAGDNGSKQQPDDATGHHQDSKDSSDHSSTGTLELDGMVLKRIDQCNNSTWTPFGVADAGGSVSVEADRSYVFAPVAKCGPTI